MLEVTSDTLQFPRDGMHRNTNTGNAEYNLSHSLTVPGCIWTCTHTHSDTNTDTYTHSHTPTCGAGDQAHGVGVAVTAGAQRGAAEGGSGEPGSDGRQISFPHREQMSWDLNTGLQSNTW